MKFLLFLPFLLLLISVNTLAQDGPPANIQLGITYGMQLPGADMAVSFGNNLNFGGSIPLMTQSGFLFGLEGYYLFGANVKDDVLSGIRTREGEILSMDRLYANITIRQRGLYLGGMAGKVFSLGQEKFKNGIRVHAGAGYFKHFIRIDDAFNNTPQIQGEYLKGYDRLTDGWALNEFIGYQYMSENQLVNFFIGFEFTQGFTQNRRAWDFKENRAINEPRIDLLWGIKAGWFLPFFIYDRPEQIRYY